MMLDGKLIFGYAFLEKLMSNKVKRERKELEKHHTPEIIGQRLDEAHRQDYLGDGILGGIDGCITTFAIVAGTVGGGFSSLVALALGVSNLIADGISMAVSNYQATSSLASKVKQVRDEEMQHIRLIPEGEKEEVRQIFARKGFEGETLEQIVETITSDHERWVDTMIQEEHGLPLQAPNPLKSAWVTFLWFCIVGVVPLIPFFFVALSFETSFTISCILTGAAFLGIGIVKGALLKVSKWKEGLSVLLTGGSAAIISYAVSHWITLYYGG